jgi:asparagine synthase (glutamine-hydrolysing)
MHLVSKAARNVVTVALSGDGGDELFGGYNRYLWGPRIWQRLRWLPLPLRYAFGKGLQSIPPRYWDGLLGHGLIQRPGEKLHKLGQAIESARGIDDLYYHLVHELSEVDDLIAGADVELNSKSPLSNVEFPVGWSSHEQLSNFDLENLLQGLAPVERMMIRDTLRYLPDDILCKVDRAAMAVSLETRVPFLDHSVVELAWRMPLSMKLRGGQGKWALRQLLYRHVPKELIERPKAGFAIPIGQWLRGPLRDWAESLLDAQGLNCQGYLRPEPIRRIWSQHLSGRYDWSQRLWTVLMFQAWLKENG